jgi:pilus assembly protein CpaB
MKPKTLVLLVVAVGGGLVASYMTSRLIAEKNVQPEPEVRVKVLVAKKKLREYTPLTKPEELFVEKEVPQDIVPKKAIKTFEELRPMQGRLNKVLNEESFLTTDDLVNKDLDGMPAKLPKGMRAVGLRVNPEALAGGFIYPGIKVDIMSVSKEGETSAQTVLQDVLVLAVDMTSTKNPDNPNMLGNTVTLALWPEEAQRLLVAQAGGEMRLAIRSLDDHEKLLLGRSKRSDLGKPLRSGQDQDTGEAPAAVALATPQIPSELPAAPTNPVVEQPKEEEPKPVKEHVLTIRTGESVSRTKFIQNDDGTWSNGGFDADEPREPRKPRAQPRPPAAGKKEQPPADKTPALQDVPQKNSGLPPVKKSQPQDL